VIVANVQGLVEIPDQVNDEPQCAAALLDRPIRIPENVQVFQGLVHDTSLVGTRTGEPGVIPRLVEWDVDVVPGRAALDLTLVLIGPSRGIGERLPRFE
jgi:hypothetical protein